MGLYADALGDGFEIAVPTPVISWTEPVELACMWCRRYPPAHAPTCLEVMTDQIREALLPFRDLATAFDHVVDNAGL